MRVILAETLLPEHAQFLDAGLNGYNERYGVGPPDKRDLVILIHDDAENCIGGLVGLTMWGWLHIKKLWVASDQRGKGHGSQLLMAAEDEARARACRQVMLDTFDFQATGFYLKHGYSVFGTLDDFPPGHARHFLRKSL